MKTIETKQVREVMKLADLIIKNGGIAEVVGGTGSGKTEAVENVAENRVAVRVCGWDGISRKQVLGEIAHHFLGGAAGAATQWVQALREHGRDYYSTHGEHLLIIADEANKFGWRQMEMLRYLADECGFAVLLAGTELYTQRFANTRTRPLLLQLGRRIGSKRVKMQHLTKKECAAYVLVPRFGQVADDVATRFWIASRRGNWGESDELASACKRVMDANDLSQLDAKVLQAAIDLQANAALVQEAA